MRRLLAVVSSTLLLSPLLSAPAQASTRITTSGSYPPLITYSILTAESGGSKLVTLDVRTGRETTIAQGSDGLLLAKDWRGSRIYYLDYQCCSRANPLESIASSGGASTYENVNPSRDVDVSPARTTLLVDGDTGVSTGELTRKPRGSTASGTDLGPGHSPHWSLSSRKVVFQRLVDDSDPGSESGDLAIYLMDPDGSDVTRVTQFPKGGSDGTGNTDAEARLSPADNRVLYEHFASDSPGYYSLYACDLDGSHTRLVSSNANTPDWAANGWLVYLKRDTRNHDQIAVRSPGVPGKEYVLTNHTYGVTAPRFRT